MSTAARIAESRGQLHEALEIAEEAVRLADDSPGQLGHRFPVCVTRGRVLIELDRLSEARSALGAGVRICEELGVRWALSFHQAYLAHGRFLAGEWDDALAELEASLKLAEEIGEIYTLVYAYGLLSLISLHRNDLSRAREAAAAADRNLAGWGPARARPGSHGRARSSWRQAANLTQALADDGRLWDWCVSAGLALEYRPSEPTWSGWLWPRGDLGRARQASTGSPRWPRATTSPAMTGEALRCQGLIDARHREPLRAAEAHAPRVTRPASSRPPARTRAAPSPGTATRSSARPLLDRAAGLYERLGAARDLARAEATLREAGIRRGRRGPRSRPQFGWPSLTPTERAVADLVAEGLSNPQIGARLYISHRTVQTHLAHVFAKLDISARAQLAAEVTRRRRHRP